MRRNRYFASVAAVAVLAGCGEATQPPLAPAGDAQFNQSQGLVRTTWPSAEDPGMPFYARIGAEQIFMVDGWAVIPFYRDPACIPANFNLLTFFDVPAAFGCPHTVEGFSLWHGEAFAGAPKIIESQGTGAVPFWFIPAGAVLDAVQDDVLTIGELAGLPGRIVGYASHFNEVLHPHPNPPFLGGGGHPTPKIIQTAQGRLEDGRRFQFHITATRGVVRSTRLRIW
jgi:hypothetical protein